MTRTVSLKIDADVKGAVNGLKTLGQATKDSAREFDKWAAKHEDSLETVSKGLVGFGAIAAGGAALAVKSFAAFDKQMSSVKAATHETETNMGLMRQAAIDAGADTAFSAVEAAKGVEELAKAGVSTEAILSGGLDGALSLAAAGELAVGDAAEIAATQMVVFGLEGKDLGHVADLLAAGAGKAQGSVKDLAMGLKYVGPVAAGMSVSIEETTGALAMFASEGIVGEQAGTSLRGMLGALTAPSKLARKEIDALGITLYDGNGKFMGLANAAEQLKGAYIGMDDAQRDASLGAIFGNETITAARVLYKQGAEGINEWTAAVNDAGYASETAALLTNNLSGDLERLGGSFDTAFIQSGGAANDVLRGFVQTAEKVVDVIGGLPPAVLGIGTVFAGVAGGAALLAAGAISVLPKIRDTRDALKDLGITGRDTGKKVDTTGLSFTTIDAAMSKTERNAKRLTGTLKTVGQGLLILAAVGPAIGSMVSSGDTANLDKLNAGLLGTSNIGKMLDESFTGKGNWFNGLDVGGFEDAMGVLIDPSWSEKVDQSVSRFFTFGSRSSSDWEFATKNVEQLDGALTGLVKGGNLDSAAESYAKISQMAQDAGLPVESLAELFPQYAAALQLVDAESKNAAEGSGALEGALGEVGAEAEEVAASLDDILASLFELGRDTRSVIEAEDALTGSLTALKDSVKENGKEFDGNSKAALANRAALVGVAADMESVIEAQARGGASSGEIAATMKGTYDAMMTATGGSEELVRSLLSIPPGVNVETFMDDQARSIAAGTADAIEAIPGYKKVEIVVSEDGTVAQVQSKVNEVTGKTEYVLVSEDGTTTKVQAGIANIKGKDVPVWVDDNGTVYTVDGKIQGIKGKNVTIVADAATADAEAQLNNAARARTALITQRVVNGGSQTSTGRGGRGGLTEGGFTGGLVGRLINGLAGGGMVPGKIPLNSQGDNILASVNGKPFGLRSGEMVVNEKATRENYSLLKAINDGATVNLDGLAKGGQVGAAESKVKSTRRSYDLIDGKKANRLRKLAAKDQWEAAKAELAAAKKSTKASADAVKKNAKAAADAAKKAAEARKKAAQEERERVSRVNEGRFDLRRETKRGEIVDAFTSGNGMGMVDRMFEASKNKDLSKKQRANMSALAYKTEKELLRLEKVAESAGKAFEKATTKRDELLSVRDGVASGLMGGFGLQSLMDDQQRNGFSKVTSKSLLASGKARAGEFKAFTAKLEKLRKMGFGTAVLDEIQGYGIDEGTVLADVLIGSTKSEVTAFNNVYKDVSKYSNAAGDVLADSMYKGGINAAESLVAAAKSKEKAVDTAFYNLGKAGQKGFHRAWGIASPSKEAKKDMGWIVAGHMSELDRLKPAFSSAMEGLYASPQYSVPPMPAPAYASYASAQPVQPKVEHHYHIDAKPGLSYEYAKDVAQQTSTRVGDKLAAYAIN